jgi:hypothetical protein
MAPEAARAPKEKTTGRKKINRLDTNRPSYGRSLGSQFQFKIGTDTALPLNRWDGDLSLTGEVRRPMVSRSGELEVERCGGEVSN